MNLITSDENIRISDYLETCAQLWTSYYSESFNLCATFQGCSDNIFKFFLHIYGYGMNKNNDRKQISLISPIYRPTLVSELLSRISKNCAFVLGVVALVNILSYRLTLYISCNRTLSFHHLLSFYETFQESDKLVYSVSSLYYILLLVLLDSSS